MTKNIYLAGPFFDEEQIDRVSRLEMLLASHPQIGEVFSPRKHQHEEYEMFSPAWQTVTYQGDVQAIDDADVVVAIVDYVDDQVDSGTAWEIGYAHATGHPIILFKEKPGSVNLMLGKSLTAFLTKESQLAEYDFDQLPSIPYDGEMF